MNQPGHFLSGGALLPVQIKNKMVGLMNMANLVYPINKHDNNAERNSADLLIKESIKEKNGSSHGFCVNKSPTNQIRAFIQNR